MKKQLLTSSLLLMLFAFTGFTAFAQSESCGPITLELYDSYGDGWNGNDMDVISSSGTTTTYTLSSGSSASYSLTVSYGDTLDFSWQGGGSWASECTYVIKDASGTTLYSSPNGGLMTAGATQYYVYCNTLSTCAMPTNLSVTTGTTTASLGWDGASSYSYHLVEYDTTGFLPGTGDTMWVYADTAHITGLMSATAYDFRVTTICSTTDSSMTAGSAGVFTQCAAFATPYSQNFDNTSSGGSTNPSLPQCWEYYKSGSNTYSTYQYTYSSTWSPGNSGSGSLYLNSSSSSSYVGDRSASMTPVIQGLDSATKMMEFYGRAGSSFYDGEFYLAYANANGDASSLRIFDTIQLASTSWGAKYTVYLDNAQTGDARIAFVMICDGAYDYMYLDDISFADIPPCPEPISLTLNGTTQTSATIGWTSSSSAFNIEVGPMGFTQGTGTSYTSTTNSYTATGLTQNTYYDAYVMANCTSTGDGTSNWVGPFTFKTECGSFTSPYSEDFGYSDGSGSSSNPDLPDCWEHHNLSPYQYNYGYVDKYYYYGNQATDSAYMYLSTYYSTYSSQTALGDTNMMILPSIAGLNAGTQQIIFKARSLSTSAAYNSKIAVATIDSNMSHSSLSIVDTIEVMGTTYADYMLDLDNVASDADHVVLIAFGMVNTGYTYGYNGAYFDIITIRDIPNCPLATNFSGAATSDSSATLSWTDSSAVTSYVIEWGPQGFTQGTGAPTDTVTGNTWSIANLMDGATYDFYILSDCMSSNGSVSPWVGPITIDVPCAPSSVPFADGFENKPNLYGNTSDPNLPDCWVYSSNGGSSYSYGSTSTWGSAYSGSGYLYSSQSNVLGDTVVVSLPMIEDLNEGGNELRFWARVSSTFYPGHMAVATTDASGNYTSASVAKNLNIGSNVYQQYSVFLDSNVVNNTSMRPAFLFYSVNGSYNYIYLDSAEVLPMPTCINYNQMASNVNDTSADLSWSYTGNNCFNVEYGPAGFIQGTGVGALSGTLDTNVSTPYTLTGLNPNTAYEFYVESCCNPGQWEGPFAFQTECSGPLASGTYSVGPTGDFATMDSVISTLNVCGIAGAVTFELQNGSFTGGTIGAVSGVSSTNTITFSGASAANDTLGPLVLDGASYVNLEDLYIRATGGFTVRLNATEYVNITGCTIETSSAASTANIPVVASASATSYSSSTEGEQYLTISDNTIFGGYFGMAMYGSSSSLGATHDVTVSNNDFVGQYYYGLYLYYARDVQVSDNYFGQFVNSTNYAGYLYQMDGCRFTGNEVESYYSILAYYWNTSVDATVQSEISNNMFKNGYYGLRIYYGAEVGVYHNTIVGSTYGLYDYYNGSSLDYRNNIIQGGTYAMYSYNSGSNFDYNVYNSLGSTLAYIYNGSFNYPTDLTSLQAVDTTMNMNSKVGNPIFAGANDLHVFGPLANDHGDNNVGVTEDIDGDSRPMSGSTTVDIGADEFDVLGDDAALVTLVSPTNGTCGD